MRVIREFIIANNPRSPFVLDVLELSRRPGSMREVSLDLQASDGFGTVVIGIPQDSPIEVDARLESVVEGVLVSGTVAGEAVGECARCLDEVVYDIDASFSELFFYPERAKAAQEEAEEDAEIVVLEDDQIDLEPLLRDSVVFALPFQPLCSPDCPGLCSECGVRLADEEGHAHEARGPMWSSLQSLFNETKES